MLILSGKKYESIMIGNDVKITITNVRGGKVRLGFTAPKTTPIYRQEIYDRIQREKAKTPE